MNIFGILTVIGGLAMFLYGMSVMGGGLEKMSGGKLERILESLTSIVNRLIKCTYHIKFWFLTDWCVICHTHLCPVFDL